MKCKNCKNLINGWCEKKTDSPVPEIERKCGDYEVKTNYDYITQMSIDEMAQAINNKTYGCTFSFGCPCNCRENYPESCIKKIKQWLEQEVEE